MIVWKLKRARASVWTDLVLWSAWILVLLASIILPLYLGLYFLIVRDCYPHFSMTVLGSQVEQMLPFNLDSTKQDDNMTETNRTVALIPQIPKESDMFADFMVRLYPPEIPVNVEDESVLVARLPRTLYRSGGQIARYQLSDYSIEDIATWCTVNGHRERRGLISLGLSLCPKNEESDIDLSPVKAWLSSLPVGTEDSLLRLVQSQNVLGAVDLLPTLFPQTGINETHVRAIQEIVRPFSEAELIRLISAFSDAELSESDLNVIDHIMSTQGETLAALVNVLKKINPENIVPITENLDALGIGLDTFLADTGVIFQFWGRQELVNLSELLPEFQPEDLEAMLTFGKVAQEAQEKYGDPSSKPLFEKLFALPLDVLLGSLGKISLNNETKQGMEAVKLIMQDPTFTNLKELAVRVMEDPSKLSGCVKQDFHLQCKHERLDRCPMGQMLLTLMCWFPLTLPGLVYAVSCLLHYRGSILQCGIGKPFQMPKKTRIDFYSAWFLVLPAYILAMIPFTLILIVYRQVRVWYGLVQEARGLSQPLEPDSAHLDHASSFGFLLGAGHGVLHVGMQAVLLGVLLLGGDILLGLDKEFYISSTTIVTLLSMILVVLILVVSQIASQESHRLSLDLPTPPRSKLYLLGSLLWVMSSLTLTIISTLMLLALIYIDTVGFTEQRMCIFSFLFLLPLPLIQCGVYQLCVRSGAEHRYAWGFFSSVVPVRFLDLDRSRTKLFLVYSQLAWFLVHAGAWILYAISVQVDGGGDVVWRTWMPVIVPALLIPTLLSFLHYSTSLLSIYSSPHVHPDMMDVGKRAKSFPPDWNKMTGSSLQTSSLAEVGFFYSCKRLKSSEATCFSCGRQVSDWSSKSANEVHKSVSDSSSCPLEKGVQDIQNDDDMSPSRVPKWIFVSLTVLCRLTAVAVFIWVFEEPMSSVSSVLPSLVLIPVLFLMVILLINPPLYFVMLQKERVGSEIIWGLFSPLVPNPASSIQYILTNSIVNTLLHVLAWAAMFGTSPAVAKLAALRLTLVWPVLLITGALSLLAILPYWYVALKPVQQYRKSMKVTTSNSGAVVSTSL